MRARSRREFLRGGAGAALAAAGAGCARLGVRLRPTPAPTGTFLDWLPTPAEVPGGGYDVLTLSLADVRARRDALHPATRRMVAGAAVWRRFRPLSEVLPGVDRLLRAGPGRVYLGADTSGLESFLREHRYEQLTPYEGFAVFEKRPLGFELHPLPEAVAVGEDAVVTSVHPGIAAVRPRRALELVVDAKSGAVRRFHEQSGGHDAVARTLDGATLGVAAVTDVEQPLGGVTLYGNRWSVRSRATEFHGTLVFEDEADARVADLRAHARSVAPGHRKRSVARSGVRATVRSEIPTARFDAGYPGHPGADGIPDVTFAVEPVDDGDRARVVHAGGQAVDAARLTVTVGGDATGRQFGDVQHLVRPGDAVTVETPGLAVVEVTWTAPDGEASLLLARAAAV